MKAYNNLTDNERFVIDEYNSWKNADVADSLFAFKLEQMTNLMKRALDLNIDHILRK